jgi:hypothetical protein
MAEQMNRLPDKLILAGRTHEANRLAPSGDTVNLAAFFPAFQPGDYAYCFAEIACPVAGRLAIQATASGSMTWYVDGVLLTAKPVTAKGSGAWRATYLFQRSVTAGKHVLAVRIVAAEKKWMFSYRGGIEPGSDAQPPATPEAPYTVRLFFSEPEALTAGARLFDIALQGTKVLEDFDILATGGPRTTVIKEFKGVRIADRLCIGFTPKRGLPLICGVQLVAE